MVEFWCMHFDVGTQEIILRVKKLRKNKVIHAKKTTVCLEKLNLNNYVT